MHDSIFANTSHCNEKRQFLLLKSLCKGSASIPVFTVVQRLMSSKGAKRGIWDDITWFPKYYWQMNIARSEDINKDDTSIWICSKMFSFRKHFVTVLTEEIWIAKVCTEVFVMPKHLMTKLNTPTSFLYPKSPLHATVLSQLYRRITCDMVKYCSVCTFT